MPQVLTDFVALLVGAVQDMAVGVAEGVSQMASSLFLKTNATTGAIEGLSIFGGIVGIFAGVALAIGLTTRVFLWISSLGK